MPVYSFKVFSNGREFPGLFSSTSSLDTARKTLEKASEWIEKRHTYYGYPGKVEFYCDNTLECTIELEI